MQASPLRIGVIGLGRAFTLMLPTFLRDYRIKLVAASDPREAARKRFEQDFRAPGFDHPEDMIKAVELDAVYIASPHQLHAAHTELAARHGLHVLLEKPMALSLDQCDRMIQACDAAGVHLIVGHCHSFNTPYLKTRDLISSGRYGSVRMIHALNYTDYLYRPRRPEELDTAEGGGAVFSQAAHQVDILRLLAGSKPVRLRAATGNWDPDRPTEGAYSAMLWFANQAFASFSYNGYGYFDSDIWMNGIGEMGQTKDFVQHYGSARRKLREFGSPETEAELKADATYGGPSYRPPSAGAHAQHQHFGPIIVSCDKADLQPLPHGIEVYGAQEKTFIPLEAPDVPRAEVIDELLAALRDGVAPLHDGRWARETLRICLALLESSAQQREVVF